MSDPDRVSIGLKELGRFSVGKNDNALYFDGEKVQTAATVSLSKTQTSFAIAAALATILGALATGVYTVVYVWSTFHKVTPAVTSSPSVSEPLSAIMLGCVGPFAVGKSDVLETTISTERARKEQCGGVDAIKVLIDKEQPGLAALSLVGAADKFRASPPVVRLYGSNDGLAQARTEWVSQQLKSKLAMEHKIPILNLIRGPGVRELKANSMDSAVDRTVAVYAFLQTRSSVPPAK